MELKKNQEITLRIDDLGNNGEGIGHVDGYALFVKDALPGETIRAKVMKCKKKYGFARMIEVLKCSGSGRVEPRCPVARQCGGCTLQHLSYEKQLAYKEKKVRDCLVRIGGVDADEVEWLPVIGMKTPWHYRNKAQFPVRMQKDDNGVLRPVAGFYAGRTHSIIPVTDCAIQHPCMKGILEAVLSWMQEQHVPAYDEVSHRGLIRHIYIRRAYITGQIMVCLVINSHRISEDLQKTLIEKLSGIPGMTGILLSINTDQTNVILGEKMLLLWGQDYIEDSIGGIRYHISPQSFYQVNPVQTEKLYQTALEFAGLTGKETVWDLYCGIGTISLFLAKNAKKVYGVEIVPEAVKNARENALLNGIQNVEFFCGAAEEVVPRLAEELEGIRKLSAEEGDEKASETVKVANLSDVVVVDPPRKGCDGVLLDTIVKMAPERIVYVSCDPATLARDVKLLGEKGYEVRKVRACDMFGQGGHVETVVQLSHKKPDSVINVKVEFGEGEGKVPLDNIAKRAAAYKPKERVTYKMIKEYIEAKYGFKVHTAYIAEVKRELGLPMYDAPNAVEELKQPRKHPTAEKVEAIKDALKYFKILRG
ncbi:MAG: 23S rRNA (uracil(1939)-C(5))-methyltransferase RlmD [Eubacterium sp.]|nr:23S rRNA (uracil(1939)-C(5))-methyltransferase RlmD [Eubacterium sp.]